MQLECTDSEQNIKRGGETNNENLFSRFMQRNEWDTADVTDPLSPSIMTNAKDCEETPNRARQRKSDIRKKMRATKERGGTFLRIQTACYKLTSF